MKTRRLFLNLFGSSALMLVMADAAQGQIRSRSGWLELSQLTGKAIYQSGSKRLQAWVGMRLTSVGEIFETEPGASAVLTLDQGLGMVRVAEQTRIRIKALHTTASGGRVTLLHVVKGRVRLKVRSMSNPESRLEIFTPVGINGVRGTDFGVSVQPSGKSSVATLSGKVDSTAMGKTQAVNQELQTFTMPGEPPEPPSKLQDNPDAQIHRSQVEGGILRLVGQTDAVNSIFIDGTPLNTDREGNFDLAIPTHNAPSIELKIVTPLGKFRKYDLPLR